MASIYAEWRNQSQLLVFREGFSVPPEQLLQGIWQHQRIRCRDLCATDGRRVTVLHPGFLNLEAGPDFRRALIQVGAAKPFECDIEIDVQSAGWRQHGHDTNPAFGGVGLHIVWRAGANGPVGLPVVELKNQLDAPLGQLADALGQSATFPPQNVRGQCAAPLRDLPAAAVADLLGQAAQARLEAKAAALAAVAERGGWEQALWEGLFTALGYKQNSWPMRRLAELLPQLRHGLGQAPEPVVLLARLLGVGGLLPEQLDRDKLTNNYLRTLWDQWWRDRDRLAKRILPRGAWTFHGLRPANRPERRLALAAHWLAKRDFVAWLDDWICQPQKKPSPAAALLGRLAVSDAYWSRHWTFRSGRFARTHPLMGVGRLHDLAVNILLPWLHARALAAGNDGLAARVGERYFAWPKGQDNSRLRFMRQRLFDGRRMPLRCAALQQGLLQVQADFCNQTNAVCDDCPFPDLVGRYSLEKT
ncbi:MAG: DUF2851 family protein [Verrucomicrobiota bacterium]|nr:DUF2851 family protein [Verrucomicrobiota bacterium]